LRAINPRKRTIKSAAIAINPTRPASKERTPMSDGIDNVISKAIQPGRAILRQLDELGVPTPESPNKTASRIFRHAGIYPLPNLVVDQCYRRFSEAVEQAIKEGESEKVTRHLGRIAYCAALPKLSGVGNIRDFIACISFAMAVEIIPSNEGTRLLYAAQVAHTALTKRPKKRNKSSHTSTASTKTNPDKSTT
jgi:hypothetical protein